MVSSAGETLKIVTRGSQLALWQANSVRDALMAAHPHLVVEIDIIKTTGDKILDVPLARIGDKGLFTKELDAALLERAADIAVHSLKDVPTRLPEGITLAAVTQREDPRDVLITRAGMPRLLAELPAGARIGTSSLRRRAHLASRRPDLKVLDLRGNLNTRLARLDAGDYEGILLAAAGVIRLGWRERITEFLEPESWLPAVGQGALAIIARSDDDRAARLLDPLTHPSTLSCATAERAFLNRLEGGCQVPIAALATHSATGLRLDGLVSDLDGTLMLRDHIEGREQDAADLGARLAAMLVERGAAEILEEVRRAYTAPPIAPP
ncbi:hydroxymethylbilane synthase [soil metagenome]